MSKHVPNVFSPFEAPYASKQRRSEHADGLRRVQRPMIRYDVERQYEGLLYVMCSEDDRPPERVASVGRFMPGPVISYEGPKIAPPALMRAVAHAMILLAAEIDANVERLRDAVDHAVAVMEESGESIPMGGWYRRAVESVATREKMSAYTIDGMIGGQR